MTPGFAFTFSLSVTSVASVVNPSATGFRETSLSSWDPGGIRTALQSPATVSVLVAVPLSTEANKVQRVAYSQSALPLNTRGCHSRISKRYTTEDTEGTEEKRQG